MSDSPELLVTGLLRRELSGHCIARPTAESELRLDLRNERAEVDEALATAYVMRATRIFGEFLQHL